MKPALRIIKNTQIYDYLVKSFPHKYIDLYYEKMFLLDFLPIAHQLVIYQHDKKNLGEEYINNIDDEGPAHARQVGIQKCDGDYIAFLDADDYLLDNVKLFITKVMCSDADFAFAKSIEINTALTWSSPAQACPRTGNLWR